MPEPEDLRQDALKRLDERLEAFQTRNERKPFRYDDTSGAGYRLVAELIGGVLAGLGFGSRVLFGPFRAEARIGRALGSRLLLRHRRTLLRLLALCLFAGMLLLRLQLLLPLPLRFLLALLLLRLLPLLVGALLLRARTIPFLLALLFLPVLLGLLPLLAGALLLQALLLGLRRGTLARVVGPRIGSMRGNGSGVVAWRGFRCLLRGRVRWVLALVLVVARILLLLLRGFARDDRAGESDRESDADDAGQGVPAQGLHVSHSGSRLRPHGCSKRCPGLTISENRPRAGVRSARVKPRGSG